MNSLFVQGFRLNRGWVTDFNEYPFNIPLIRDLNEIRFNKPVTFIVGENGSGKSTIIEALAVTLGLSAEGGSRNMVYETVNSTSNLNEYITLLKSGDEPKWKYFLRAESFYTMATAYEEYKQPWERGMHEFSHGEEFGKIFDSFSNHGLYLLDEPESALSPKNQMRFLCKMHQLSQNGSQFIIVTHSPILLSYFNAEILNADNNLLPINYKDTEIYNLYRRFLDSPETMQKYLFEEE